MKEEKTHQEFWSELREFQTLLLADDQKIWHWLGELRQEATDVPPGISNLRILDVVLGMSGSTARSTVVL